MCVLVFMSVLAIYWPLVDSVDVTVRSVYAGAGSCECVFICVHDVVLEPGRVVSDRDGHTYICGAEVPFALYAELDCYAWELDVGCGFHFESHP